MSTLRQKKAAQTRIGLLEALIERLTERPLDDVPISQLCTAAGVSQATFFNYYESKHALLMFYVQLWSIEMAWEARRHDDPLCAIEAVFQATAREGAKGSGILGEVIAYQARFSVRAPTSEPTDADLLRMYPDLEGILEMPRDTGIDGVISPLLHQAIRGGQLPATTDVNMALCGVLSVFFGGGVLTRQVPGLALSALYAQQLRWLWTALRQE
ncbi:MAG: AcrR family transcriptional regulator [Kiritimatiellia bacterium]|jgi:AcrR family transcriptional regulator